MTLTRSAKIGQTVAVSTRPRRRITVGPAVRFVVTLVIAAVVFLPVYVSFLSAFTPNGSIVRSGLVPQLQNATLLNFRVATAAVPIWREYLVSLLVVVIQTVGEVLTGALAAYALVFPQWRGRRWVFVAVLATLAVPGESLVIPNYELVSDLGLRNTVLGVALPYLAAGYVVFLLRQTFLGVPREIWEAARLDGAGDLRALFAVVMPATRAQVTTAVIWAALGAWNGFFWPLLITDTASSRTIQVGISQLAASESGTPAVIFAGTVLVVIPTIVLVVFAQRFLIAGLAQRAVR